jgi:hypothetical protein
VAEGENDKTRPVTAYRIEPGLWRAGGVMRFGKQGFYTVPLKDIELLHKSNAGKDLNRESEGEGGGYIGSR